MPPPSKTGMGHVNWLAVVKELKPNTAKPHTIVVLLSVVAVLIVILLHWLDPIAGWIAVMLMQLVQLLALIFNLITLQEYEDHMTREPAEVERMINPLRSAERALRVVHVLEFLWLGNWWVPLCLIAPAIAYDYTPLQTVPRVEATRLWKDVAALKNEGKWKLAYSVTLFFIVMFVMLYHMIFHLDQDVKPHHA